MSPEIVVPHQKAQAFTLPYEPNYTAHRQTETRRRRNRMTLRRWTPADQTLPSIVPDDALVHVDPPTEVSPD